MTASEDEDILSGMTAREALDVIEDHRPDISGDISDSLWLDCVCGEAVDWHQHLVDAVETSWSKRDSRQSAGTATPLPEPGLDVERLAEAWANVMDGRRIGRGLNAARIGRDTTTPEDWWHIATEYARLAESAGKE